MRKKKLPKSLRRFIRQGKARIRREFFDAEKIKEEVKKLYGKAGIAILKR